MVLFDRIPEYYYLYREPWKACKKETIHYLGDDNMCFAGLWRGPTTNLGAWSNSFWPTSVVSAGSSKRII